MTATAGSVTATTASKSGAAVLRTERAAAVALGAFLKTFPNHDFTSLKTTTNSFAMFVAPKSFEGVGPHLGAAKGLGYPP